MPTLRLIWLSWLYSRRNAQHVVHREPAALALDPLRRDQRAARERAAIAGRMRQRNRFGRPVEADVCVPGMCPARVDDTSIGRAIARACSMARLSSSAVPEGASFFIA